MARDFDVRGWSRYGQAKLVLLAVGPLVFSSIGDDFRTWVGAFNPYYTIAMVLLFVGLLLPLVQIWASDEARRRSDIAEAERLVKEHHRRKEKKAYDAEVAVTATGVAARLSRGKPILDGEALKKLV